MRRLCLGAVALVAAAGATAAAAAPTAPVVHSDRLRLRLEHVISGAISPKSVDVSPSGLVLAQNMMYRHTITVYDRRFRLVRTIPDTVSLARFGFPRYRGSYRGAPVEAAFSPDGRFAYVSNYSMYGRDLVRPGDDVCSPSAGYDRSFVYRIRLATLRVDRVIRVGTVPKYLAVTPDDRYLLVSNWCSYDLSVVSIRKEREVKRLPLGPYPRGIAVDPKSRFAYVAVMGSTSVARIDLRRLRVSWITGVGSGPRHLVIGPLGRFLYVTLNGDGRVAKIDLRRRRVVSSVYTGSQPRSMTIAPDGRSLYVVNYESQSVSKIRASDMRVVQTVPTNTHPIGISYDGPRRRLWVSCYTGTIMVFRDVRASAG